MRLGVMTAIEQEVSFLLRHARGFERVEALGRRFWFGRLGRHQVALTQCGVGKVRAAACAQFLVDRYAVEALVFAGVAGALNPQLRPGDVVISRRVLQHDYDNPAERWRSPLSSPWLEADPKLAALAYGIAADLLGPSRVVLGSVLTGDQAITQPEKKDWLREKYGGDCVEMEGAAVGEVCAMNGRPFVLVRGISDLADGHTLRDFLANVHAAAEVSAQIVLSLIERLD